MLKTVCKIVFISILLSSATFCKELSTDQQKIDSAIEIIKKYGYEKNIAILQGANYTHKPVTIMFKDLSEVNFSYAKFCGITATDNNGDLYILINQDLRNSDPKALACLVLHESTHSQNNISDSLEEETIAHQRETILYIRLLEDDESLQYKTNDRLITKLNRLKKLYDEAVMSYLSNNENYVKYLHLKK